MTTDALGRARTGDEEAFRELTDPYRRELHLHCYQILGSVQDAEDTLQETLLAAWRGVDRFEERASVRTWLYKIATNQCLNALRTVSRRPAPLHWSAPPPEPTRRTEPLSLQPYPDALLEELPANEPGPEIRYERREAVALAFEAADIERLLPLLTEDAMLTMPTAPLEYQGHTAIAEFLMTRPHWRGPGARLVPTAANYQPAFGCYRAGPHESLAQARGLIVLTLAGERIAAITRFEPEGLFSHFGLKQALPG